MRLGPTEKREAACEDLRRLDGSEREAKDQLRHLKTIKQQLQQ